MIVFLKIDDAFKLKQLRKIHKIKYEKNTSNYRVLVSRLISRKKFPQATYGITI